MKTILLALLITLVPAMPKEPQLKMLTNGHSLLVNPLKKKVFMRLDCGLNWEQIYLELEPNSKQELTVVDPDGNAAYCIIQTWGIIP